MSSMHPYRAVGRSRLNSRRLLLSGVLLAVLASPLGPTAARAQTAPDLVCTENSQLDFDPPLTAVNTRADTTLTLGLVGCSSPNGSYPKLRAGTAMFTGTATSAGGPNPCSLLVSGELTGRITWSPTGQRSDGVNFFSTDPGHPEGIKIELRITKGPLEDDVTSEVSEAHPNPDCAVAGLKSLTGSVGEIVFYKEIDD